MAKIIMVYWKKYIVEVNTILEIKIYLGKPLIGQYLRSMIMKP